jgi:two-component system, NtrC family, sensor histidine kinase HydH
MPLDPLKRPFNLLRWFSLASLAVIGAIAVVSALWLSDFLSKRMLLREAEFTRDVVQAVLLAEGSYEYFTSRDDPALAERFRGTIDHFAAMQDVLRNNVYARDGTVLWSSDAQLIGRNFGENDELDDALKGEIVVKSGRITDEARRKPEHVGLNPGSDYFVETYIPVRGPGGREVLGVVEIYKAPVELTKAIAAGQRQIWASAFAGALLMYVTLYWIVWRGNQTIRRQDERLREAETLSAVGELASSVAHNIRNPLASIRTSAELAIDLKGEDCTEQAKDIMSAVDRVEAWMRELLRFTRQEPGPRAPVDVAALVRKCFNDMAREFERHKLAATVADESHGARVNADPALLEHALHSVVANAVEATPEGGRVEGRVARNGGDRIQIRIHDTGPGIAPGDLPHVFRPFYTTKPGGFGLGLAQVRRAVERFGGEVRIDSVPGAGTTVTLELPRAV